MMDPKVIKQAMEYREMIDALMGDHVFADIVLVNGNVINTITREVYQQDIAIKRAITSTPHPKRWF